jgi:hypothetical protein
VDEPKAFLCNGYDIIRRYPNAKHAKSIPGTGQSP